MMKSGRGAFYGVHNKDEASSHKKGPRVEPCPGPYRSSFSVFWYDVVEIPYFVLILWIVCCHVSANDSAVWGFVPSRLMQD